MVLGRTGLLPTIHNPANVSNRSTLRLKEKYVLLLISGTFVTFCIGGLFFLPELKAGTQFAYKSIRDAGPDLLGIVPPVEERYQEPKGENEVGAEDREGQIHKNPYLMPITSRYKISDMQRLADKIKQELNSANLSQIGAVLPKPFTYNNGQLDHSEHGHHDVGGEVDEWSPILLDNGDPGDEETRSRRNVVRGMMKHAWDNYVRYAWGSNELRPITMKGHSASIFGKTMLGATIVDGMSTLFIMGLKKEFKKGREWIKNHLNIEDVHTDMSVFETNIRFVGGLLSCYALTKDQMFLDKAVQFAKKLLPAFNTPTGIPYALINPKSGFAKNYIWASGGSSILSEIGTMHLEFVYLSDITGDKVYRDKVMAVRDHLMNMKKPRGLYPNYIHPKTGRWGQHHISMGALGDSFYEYLLKAWIQSGGKDTNGRRMYDEALSAIENHLLKKSRNGLLYFAEMKYDRLEHKMDHLACFSGGTIALGAQSLDEAGKSKYTHMGAELANTCHESYESTETKLGPESFRFSENVEAKATRPSEKYYIQRPEVIESYFYLWRLTKDPKYRDWAFEAVQAIEKHCRVEGGYTGLKNVYDPQGPKDDVQQSYFLAETLKYLYLIFSNDKLMSLDQWVYNTEAHPLPIQGKNPAYPIQQS